MKRINADYYTEDKYIGCRENRHQIFGKNGTLFAYGIYPTKIRKEDLSSHYVYGYSSGGYRYFKTKGIVDLVYVPSYDNHPLKYDRLYISFHKKINCKNVEHATWLKQEEYDYLIWDELVVLIVKGAEKYSNLNVKEIKKAIDLKKYYYYINEDKEKWYRYFEEIKINEKEKERVAEFDISNRRFYKVI